MPVIQLPGTHEGETRGDSARSPTFKATLPRFRAHSGFLFNSSTLSEVDRGAAGLGIGGCQLDVRSPHRLVTSARTVGPSDSNPKMKRGKCTPRCRPQRFTRITATLPP